jgi:glycerate kinase
MRIIIAPDSFKDALNSIEVAEAIARGIRRVLPKAIIDLCPIADGGEGTLEVLKFQGKWQIQMKKVAGPRFEPVAAKWLSNPSVSTGFIEMAQAAGLQLLDFSKRNPMHTTTYGVGELIRQAANDGLSKILLSIGGSATNDAGIGMASALGWQFLDERDSQLLPVGCNLIKIAKILPPQKPILLSTEVWCDVENPLFGPDGAAFTYAAQKGASPADIQKLDVGLQHFNEKVKEQLGLDLSELPGGGAAGGLGTGAVLFLNATLVSGIEAVLKLIDFYEKLTKADLVITGEGHLDKQTRHGKVISGICKAAAVQSVPVVALCGKLSIGKDAIHELGLIDAVMINENKVSLPEALANTAANLEDAAARFIRGYPVIG